VDQAEAFLQAIAEAPDDEPLRLIYADWLEENGDPVRAEFIRVQCELERLPEHDPRRPELETREQALLGRHRDAWAPPLGGLILFGEFSRGFLDILTARTLAFLERGAELFRLTPVRHLRLLHAAESIKELAASPNLARVPILDFRAGDLAAKDLAELAKSQHLRRLKTLDLGHNRIGWGDGVKQLATSPHLIGLTALHLNGNPLGPRGVRALVSTARLDELTDLNLKQTNLGPDGLIALVNSPLMTRLTRLNLDWNPLGPKGAAQLAASAAAARLTELRLRGTQLDNRAAQLLADSPHLQRLTFLDVRHNPIGPAEQEALHARFGDGVVCSPATVVRV
jgi:uncharacterized protein (TIGR02996 family)